MSNVDTAVQVTKRFPVQKDELYRAWTEEGQLKQWWKPQNRKLTNVENDIRVGGTVRYEFEDGLQISGTYKEVEEGKKLVYRWNWQLPEPSIHDGDYLLTVEFSEEGEGSRIAITQDNIRNEHGIKPHEEGWQESLEALRHHLAGSR